MKWNSLIRQIHRWLSIAFTIAVIINIASWQQKEPAAWVGILALVPLVILLVTGLYMFALPYASKWRASRPAGHSGVSAQ